MTASEAQRITVSAGQQIDDLVMVLKPIKASRVSGTATGVRRQAADAGHDHGDAVERRVRIDDAGARRCGLTARSR